MNGLQRQSSQLEFLGIAWLDAGAKRLILPWTRRWRGPDHRGIGTICKHRGARRMVRMGMSSEYPAHPSRGLGQHVLDVFRRFGPGIQNSQFLLAENPGVGAGSGHHPGIERGDPVDGRRKAHQLARTNGFGWLGHVLTLHRPHARFAAAFVVAGTGCVVIRRSTGQQLLRSHRIAFHIERPQHLTSGQA